MAHPASNHLALTTVATARGPIEEAAEDILTHFFLLLVQKDQATFGSTCKKFHVVYLKISPIGRGVHALHSSSSLLAVELVNAAKARALMASQAHALGVPYEYTPDLENKALYSQALQNFFKNFQHQFSGLQMQPDLVIYPTVAFSAQNLIRSTFKEQTTDAAQLIKTTMVIYDFNQMVFLKMCEAYGNQPIPAITIQSYKSCAASLKAHFPRIDIVDIEMQMRNAILLKHSSQELTKFAQGLLGNTPQDAPDRKNMEALAALYQQLSTPVSEVTKARRFGTLQELINK